MQPIKFNKIEPQTVEVWNSDGFFARVNEYEFNDIRIQIRNFNRNNPRGGTDWYALYNDQKIKIDTDGKVEDWPRGFFDMFGNQLFDLL
jgi:hypothetical protein